MPPSGEQAPSLPPRRGRFALALTQELAAEVLYFNSSFSFRKSVVRPKGVCANAAEFAGDFNQIVELSAVKSCGFGNVSETWSAVEPQTSKAPSDLING